MAVELKKFDFEVVQLPTFEEVVKNRDWVFFGADNLWPQHSVQLYNYSSINRACINSKRDAVWGKQMLIDGVDANLVMANSSQSVREVFKNAAMDMVLHNGFALNTILRRDREGVSEFYHMDFTKLRSGKVDEFDYVKTYYYCSDWVQPKVYKPREIDAFNIDGETPTQVWYYKNYSPTQSYYPVNDWIGARVAVETDINIKQFHLQNLQNGFFPSALLSLNNGIPGDEEREQIYRHMVDKYSSSNNSGKLLLTFSESKDNEPTFTPLNLNNSDTFYSVMDEQIRNTILTGHRISSPALIGIAEPRGLGSKDEILDAYGHFLASVIVPIQEQLIKEFEKLLFLRDKRPHEIVIIQNNILFQDL